MLLSRTLTLLFAGVALAKSPDPTGLQESGNKCKSPTLCPRDLESATVAEPLASPTPSSSAENEDASSVENEGGMPWRDTAHDRCCVHFLQHRCKSPANRRLPVPAAQLCSWRIRNDEGHWLRHPEDRPKWLYLTAEHITPTSTIVSTFIWPQATPTAEGEPLPSGIHRRDSNNPSVWPSQPATLLTTHHAALPTSALDAAEPLDSEDEEPRGNGRPQCVQDTDMGFRVAMQNCTVTLRAADKNWITRTLECNNSDTSLTCQRWDFRFRKIDCKRTLTCLDKKHDDKTKFCSFPNCCSKWQSTCDLARYYIPCKWKCIDPGATKLPPRTLPELPEQLTPRDVPPQSSSDKDAPPSTNIRFPPAVPDTSDLHKEAQGKVHCTRYEVEHDDKTAGPRTVCVEYRRLHKRDVNARPPHHENCYYFPNCCNLWRRFCHFYEGEKTCLFKCEEKAEADHYPPPDNPDEG